MAIDSHTHYFPPQLSKELRKKSITNGPRIVRDPLGNLFTLVGGETYGPVPEELYNLEKRIKNMDVEGVGLQILSVVPFNFSYGVDPFTGTTLAHLQNNMIANVAETHPDRFVGAATVPLQDLDNSVEELERAIKDLGLKGVEIGSNIAGKTLDSLDLWPFYEKVEALNVPVIVHPIAPIGAERLKKYYLENLVGFPMETSIAIASIIFGGVLERFKKIKFFFLHGGGFIPYQIGRLEHGYKVRPEPKKIIAKPPSEYLKKIFVDTITHYQPALTYLVELVGSERVLMGSDFPYDMGDPHPILSVQKLQSLSNEEKEQILHKNAAEIFGIH